MKERLGFIYILVCLVNGKGYVGQTIKSRVEMRWAEHVKTAFVALNKRPLYCALRRYGLSNFVGAVLWTGPESGLNAAEKRFIRQRKTFHDWGAGYNLTTGGDHFKPSKAAIHNMRKAQTKRFSTVMACLLLSERLREVFAEHPEYAERIGASKRGTVTPKYVRRKISRALKVVQASEDLLSAQSAQGKARWRNSAYVAKQKVARVILKNDVAHCKRLSKARKNNWRDPEYVQRWRTGQRRRWEREEEHEKASNAHKLRWTAEARLAASLTAKLAWTKFTDKEREAIRAQKRIEMRTRRRLPNGRIA